jgi:hypothetical protein
MIAGKTPYHYARDINVTIGSDGNDLRKGYTFMFGGMGNTASMILRDGVEVQRANRSIPTDMTPHQAWFALRIERRGGHLTFRIGRAAGIPSDTELVYDDPKPLEGDRIAIWTYDHGIILSRVQISGHGGSQKEHPDLQLIELKTPYSNR